MKDIIKLDDIKDLILEIRGQRVLLDVDVARIYGVETKRINEAVKNNKGKYMFLPWKKDSAHNSRLNSLGELISEPYHLRTSGRLAPDNAVTVGGYIVAGVFGISYLVAETIGLKLASPENLEQLMFVNKVILLSVISGITAPTLGSIANLSRFKDLPRDEAKYLDMKIKLYYS